MITSLCCNEPVLVAGGVGLGATRWHQCRKCLQATDPVDWKAQAIAAETLLDKLNDAFDAARKEGSARRVPAEEVEELRRSYNQLIMAVARKFDGESRHETALRYINEAETPNLATGSEAKRVAEGRE